MYVMADHWTLTADASWVGVEWYVPASLSGDNHYILAYQNGDGDSPRRSTLIHPVAGGGLQQFLFGTALPVTGGVSYRACVLTNHYVFTPGHTFPQTDGHLTTDGFFLKVTSPDDAKYPDSPTSLNFHISPLVDFPGTSGALGLVAEPATGAFAGESSSTGVVAMTAEPATLQVLASSVTITTTPQAGYRRQSVAQYRRDGTLSYRR